MGSRYRSHFRLSHFGAGLLLLLGVLFGLASSASAVTTPKQIGTFGSYGAGAGQFREIRGIVADPDSGHVFVVDTLQPTPRNNRINEFTAWGEFVKSWGWGVRNGASALQTCGPGAVPPSTTCEAGVEGSGPGQLNQPQGITLDSSGDLYVFERFNARVQKFSPDGEFILMFGGGVNKTTGADVCTQIDVEGGDECGAGAVGTGNSEFSVENVSGSNGNYIDVAPDGSIFVGDQNRIQKFDSEGNFEAAIALPEPGVPGALSVDPTSGDIYFAYAQSPGNVKPGVYRLNPVTGTVLGKLGAAIPVAISVDVDGNVWIVDQVDSIAMRPEVLEYSPEGAAIIPPGSKFARPPVRNPELSVNRLEEISAIATNTVTAGGGVAIYLNNYNVTKSLQRIKFYGAPPELWPPPLNPPSIDAQFASSVGTTTATVKAGINPRFWADTRFYLEYGTAPCSEIECAKAIDPPGTLLGAGIVGETVISTGALLEGLQPGTKYYFRYVAESSGGGPTFGQGEDELEGTFTTFAEPSTPASCGNQAFRIGSAANLPDCRAYEMVSPIDKNDSDIAVQCNQVCFAARLDQVADAGGKFSYSAYRSFADQPSSPYASQYLATRTADGWVTKGVNPPHEGAPNFTNGNLDVQYQFFNADLSDGLLLQATEPILAPGGIAEFENLYSRDLVSGAYTAMTKLAPVDKPTNEFNVQVQGVSDDYQHIVFRANGKLTANAASLGRWQTYEFFEGNLRLVSVRPNGTVSLEGSSLGRSNGAGIYREATLTNALSADGSHAFWTEAEQGAGKLYVRINGTQTKLISNQPVEFVAAAADGSKVTYLSAGSNPDLLLYDLGTEEDTPIAPEVTGVAGASEDLSRIYFSSRAALAPGGEAGQQNLYLYESGGGIAFVAALTAADLAPKSPYNPVAPEPIRRSSRVSADGSTLMFMSSGNSTGYDNTDAVTGEADTEVFIFDADSSDLLCVSCNPTNARPTGQLLVTPGGETTATRAAARIPGWESQLFAPRVLSEGGTRAFFESYEPLVLRDSNGARDVYQWERAGIGTCTESDGDFNVDAGGCVSLISSGQSPTGAEFIDATPDGSEAFFAIAQSLVPQDPQYVDVYSARIGGGFASPPSPPQQCEGEGCQTFVPAPGFSPPASQGFVAPEEKVTPPKKKCGKGKHPVKRNGKSRCVKNKKKKKGSGKKTRSNKRSRGGAR